MTAHNTWLNTDGGKQFVSLFGQGGKYENIAVLFDAVEPNRLPYGAYGSARLDMINYLGDVTQIGQGAVSKEIVDAAGGKSINSYIRSTLKFGTFSYADNNRIAELIDTYSHEGQHTIISVASILKNGSVPQFHIQHAMMQDINGQYFKTRFNSFMQIRSLWNASYNRRYYEDRIGINRYVQERVNDF
jgi:hypothetical protein